MYTMESICAQLEISNPWPMERPAVPTDDHNWFVNGKALEDCLESSYLILELGAWLGGSTRFLSDRSSFVITVDHWLGSENQRTEVRTDVNNKLPHLYETFLTNCWAYRDKILPLRMSTSQGMDLLLRHKVVPDLIYIDADHSYDACARDIEDAFRFGGKTTITGDDWAWGSDKPVRRAVTDFARGHGMRVYARANFWRLYRVKGPDTVMTESEKALADAGGVLNRLYNSSARRILMPSASRRFKVSRVAAKRVLELVLGIKTWRRLRTRRRQIFR
jgi:hypothetical protein